VAGKRAKYGVNHIPSLTTGFHVAALERFVYFHPDTIRPARTLGAIHASRLAPLMEDHIVAGAPDQNGLEARRASSSAASRIRTRTCSDATRSSRLHAANASAPVPFRYRRKWKKPVAASWPGGAEHEGAMPGDADVAGA